MISVKKFNQYWKKSISKTKIWVNVTVKQEFVKVNDQSDNLHSGQFTNMKSFYVHYALPHLKDFFPYLGRF